MKLFIYLIINPIESESFIRNFKNNFFLKRLLNITINNIKR